MVFLVLEFAAISILLRHLPETTPRLFGSLLVTIFASITCAALLTVDYFLLPYYGLLAIVISAFVVTVVFTLCSAIFIDGARVLKAGALLFCIHSISALLAASL